MVGETYTFGTITVETIYDYNRYNLVFRYRFFTMELLFPFAGRQETNGTVTLPFNNGL